MSTVAPVRCWGEDAEFWRRARCRQLDPELWFASNQRKAKQVCAGCPIKAGCLAYALEKKISHGMWGGKSCRERRYLGETPTRMSYVYVTMGASDDHLGGGRHDRWLSV